MSIRPSLTFIIDISDIYLLEGIPGVDSVDTNIVEMSVVDIVNKSSVKYRACGIDRVVISISGKDISVYLNTVIMYLVSINSAEMIPRPVVTRESIRNYSNAQYSRRHRKHKALACSTLLWIADNNIDEFSYHTWVDVFKMDSVFCNRAIQVLRKLYPGVIVKSTRKVYITDAQLAKQHIPSAEDVLMDEYRFITLPEDSIIQVKQVVTYMKGERRYVYLAHTTLAWIKENNLNVFDYYNWEPIFKLDQYSYHRTMRTFNRTYKGVLEGRDGGGYIVDRKVVDDYYYTSELMKSVKSNSFKYIGYKDYDRAIATLKWFRDNNVKSFGRLDLIEAIGLNESTYKTTMSFLHEVFPGVVTCIGPGPGRRQLVNQETLNRYDENFVLKGE